MDVINFLNLYNDADVALEVLESHYGITNVRNDEDERVILNYDLIDSPKTDPIVKECRGLVLEHWSWKIVARSFPRFFNYGECLTETIRFNWNDFTCTSKEDGSLILLYWYKDKWRVNTRNSFGQGEVGISGKTWEEHVFSILKDVSHLDKDNTYIFELVGPHNKVVRSYSTTSLFLLTIIDNKTGTEYISSEVDYRALRLGVARPATHHFTSAQELTEFLQDHPEATFEGFVVRDNTGLRLKIKNPRYVALHRLRGNGDGLFTIKNLISFILAEVDDESEILTYFPEVKDIFYQYKKKIDNALDEMYIAWEKAKNIRSQKEFAITVKGQTKFDSILFKARKSGRSPREIWRESSDLIIKKLFR